MSIRQIFSRRTFAAGALLCASLVMAQVQPAFAQGVDTSNPGKLIDSAAKAMLKELDADRASFKADPKKVYALVDRILLPNFDTAYAGQLVLGPQWRQATPDQRQRFVNAFYKSMLNSYGDALVDFTADRLNVLPWRGDAASQRATVRSTVRRDNGTTVDVRYELRKAGTAWKVFDVVIDGISYVEALKRDFGAEIAQTSLDAVIKRLETNGAPPAIKAKSK